MSLGFGILTGWERTRQISAGCKSSLSSSSLDNNLVFLAGFQRTRRISPGCETYTRGHVGGNITLREDAADVGMVQLTRHLCRYFRLTQSNRRRNRNPSRDYGGTMRKSSKYDARESNPGHRSPRRLFNQLNHLTAVRTLLIPVYYPHWEMTRHDRLNGRNGSVILLS